MKHLKVKQAKELHYFSQARAKKKQGKGQQQLFHKRNKFPLDSTKAKCSLFYWRRMEEQNVDR